MKRLTQEEVDKIIADHQHFLKEDCDGWEQMRGDLSYCDLTGLDFSYCNLRAMTFRGSDLRDADFFNANCSHSDFSYTNLIGVSFQQASLAYSKMYKSVCIGTEFIECDLSCAQAEASDFCRADLTDARLTFGSFVGSNFTNAIFDNTTALSANFSHAKNVPNIPLACPETGSFIGFKKAWVIENGMNCGTPCIVKLEIPADAKRSSATSSKCRADKAKVLSIESLDGKAFFKQAMSRHDNRFVYTVGEVVCAPNFDMNRYNECAPGIHFFVQRELAEAY